MSDALAPTPSHVSYAALENGLGELAPPKDKGKLACIVVRGPDGRATPQSVRLTPAEGVPGDAWARKAERKIDAQISVMRADVARLFAQGQPLSVFGDNLLVDLDLSTANLPEGSRVRLGSALLEVTPLAHTGCAKFRQRAGDDALRLTAATDLKALRLRGLFMKVIEGGEVATGDEIEILTRPG